MAQGMKTHGKEGTLIGGQFLIRMLKTRTRLTLLEVKATRMKAALTSLVTPWLYQRMKTMKKKWQS